MSAHVVKDWLKVLAYIADRGLTGDSLLGKIQPLYPRTLRVRIKSLGGRKVPYIF